MQIKILKKIDNIIIKTKNTLDNTIIEEKRVDGKDNKVKT